MSNKHSAPIVQYIRKTWASREEYEHGPLFNESEIVDVTDEVDAMRHLVEATIKASTQTNNASDAMDEIDAAVRVYLDAS